MQTYEALVPELYHNATCEHCLVELYVRKDTGLKACRRCGCLYSSMGKLLNASHDCFLEGVTSPGFTM